MGRVYALTLGPVVASGGAGAITHGDQLTSADVGPWAAQGVSKGSETLYSISTPGRGYFRIDTPSEFASASAWPSNANDANPSVLNAPSLHSGVVTGSPVTIDGYSIPVGTTIVQWGIFSACDFYAQGASGGFLFRGCQFRANSFGDSGLINDYTADSSFHFMLHYCTLGGTDANSINGGLVKNIGGASHRYLRNYSTWGSTFYQPNVTGCVLAENYIDKFVFPYGESGSSGLFDSSVFHLNGISMEGGLDTLYILRNHILAPSPDECTGSTGYAAGEVGYGTQSGQTGYGSGTAPGRLVNQTDCIALFVSNSVQWDSTEVQVHDNYIGGTGYPLYVEGTPHNVSVSGNTFTTQWWTNSGSFGVVSYGTFSNGVNGCVQTDNTWADDYGTGGDGTTLIADRQYPSGNGPRVGATVF